MMSVAMAGNVCQSPAAAMRVYDVRFDAVNSIIESFMGKFNGAGEVPALNYPKGIRYAGKIGFLTG